MSTINAQRPAGQADNAQERADWDTIDQAVADAEFHDEAAEIRQALSRDDLTPQQRDALHAQQRRLYAERYGERPILPGGIVG